MLQRASKVVTRQTTSKKLHLDAALVDNGDASSDRYIVSIHLAIFFDFVFVGAFLLV